MSEYLTPAEVASKLGVTEHSVRRWLREGTLPGIKVGKVLRIPRDFESQLRAAQQPDRREVAP